MERLDNFMTENESKILRFFSTFIEKELGVIYSEGNYFQLQNRLDNVAKSVGLKSADELYTLASKGVSDELKRHLVDAATNNETSFFRDQKLFQAIENLLKEHLQGNLFPDKTINFWSAASSTGQEALSLAILINELRSKNGNNFPFSILGTDISETALAKAKNSSYSELEVNRGMPINLLEKYFSKTKDHWTAKGELIKDIRFEKLNLKAPKYPDKKFHFILCRNVLIYQNVASKIEIIKRLTSCLVPRGFLILGSGESLMGLSDEFEALQVDGAWLYRKKVNV